MFDRETRRAKIVEARSRVRRDAREKSANSEVKFNFCFLVNLFITFLKKTVKTTAEDRIREYKLLEDDSIEKAEKLFWEIIKQENGKQDQKTVLVSFYKIK